jgi:hypothetical protein
LYVKIPSQALQSWKNYYKFRGGYLTIGNPDHRDRFVLEILKDPDIREFVDLPPALLFRNIKGSALEPFILFGFDIAVRVGRVVLIRLGGQPVPKRLDAPAELPGDPSNAPGTKKQQDD